MIAIIDGCGTNIASVQFAIERLGKSAKVTQDIDVIKSASHVVLPGVGTAKKAMTYLQHHHLVEVISQLQQPVLGICLGMQIFYQSSTEGSVNCLGMLSGEIDHLAAKHLPIPHMGWNQLAFDHDHPLLQDVDKGNYVYFVHSYAAPINHHTIATTQYGDSFSAMVQQDNFYGVQFHPERSGMVGEIILRNFLALE